MFKNYVVTAWRNLLRNKVFSAINIIGLAVGMAAVLLIGIWAQNEFGYDRFYHRANDLYKVYYSADYNGIVYTNDITSAPIGAALKQDFPEVENSARIYWSTERLFHYGDKNLKAKGNDVDKAFLPMFDFPLLRGNAAHALDDVSSIVITESLARSLFGEDGALGKTVKINNEDNYTVTGVLKDLPANTEFDFDYLVNVQRNEQSYGTDWGTQTYYTFVQLKPGVDIISFNKKIRKEQIRHFPESNSDVFLYPVSQQHLYSHFENGKPAGGRIDTVRLVLIIGGLILLIACINFMNLSTAQSSKRAKEVGVRKVIGAGKSRLVSQFLCESVVMAFVAGVVAVFLVQLTLPFFNGLVNESLSFHFSDPFLWVSLSCFVLLTGLLAGSYPAFFLSAFTPVTVLKGEKASAHRRFTPRKILVVTQFTVAIVLIISSVIVYRQIQYVQARDAGYNVKNVIEVPIEGDIRKNYDVIRSELQSKGVVTAMCKNSLGVTVDGATRGGYSWEGSTPDDQNISFSLVGTEGDFIQTTGLTLLAGRDINLHNYPYDTASVMINEAALKAMRLPHPVGKTIDMNGAPRTIVGVFKNFIIGSPYEAVRPMAVIGTNYWTYHIIMRFNNKNTTAANLEEAGKVFQKYNPAYPFTYRFVDEEYAQKFAVEKQTGSLAALFAGLAIFISCLGLFGLAAYMAESRSKEIGIRKVLGASVSGIAAMLSKEFIWLVGIAILIATPVGWYLMNQWLQRYTYRIEVSAWMFVAAGAAAILIAVITVSFQAVKAAMASPVKSLRTE